MTEQERFKLVAEIAQLLYLSDLTPEEINEVYWEVYKKANPDCPGSQP